MHRVKTQKYTKAELLDSLKGLANKLNRPPRQKDLDADKTLPQKDVFVHNFGSWAEALVAAGLDVYCNSKSKKENTIIFEKSDLPMKLCLSDGESMQRFFLGVDPNGKLQLLCVGDQLVKTKP